MLKGLNYIIGNNPRILILGSMPSVKSLQQQEYYAHPSNRFWRILEDLYGVTFIDFEDKKKFLRSNGIALWDVIDICEREGSLDSNIKSEIPNDIGNLIQMHPSVQHIYCNGKKAYDLLVRYFPDLKPITISLPSTSSANQSKTYSEILKEWSQITDDK